MKIGVSSYSFSQRLRTGEMTQLDAVKKAKEIGFEAIEFTDLQPPEGVSNLEYARQIREEAKKCGMEISVYVVGADFAKGSKEEIAAEVARVKTKVDEAKALGVTKFRHDQMWNYNGFRSFDAAFPTLVECTREITEYAEKLGIRTMSENHGYIAQDPDRMERLAAAVNHPNYGLLIDIGNFLCADVCSVEAVSRLANLAFMVHAKDFKKIDFYAYNGEPAIKTRASNYLKATVIGKGDVCVEQCLDILKQAGYNGYIDVEYEGADDCMEALKESVAFLRKILG